MATGATNLVTTFVSGNPLPAAAVDDITSLLVRLDDEILYDLIALDPPASASATNVNVGFVPITTGTHVTANGGARYVSVAPTRWFRSSISNASPRRMLSAINDIPVTITEQTAPASGFVRVDLLCARISYVNAAEPAKGTQVAFEWVSGAQIAIGGTPVNPPPSAHTTTSWVVPVAYVTNSAADAIIPQGNITDVVGLNGNGQVMNLRALSARATAVEGRATAVEGRATAVEGRATTLEGRATTIEGAATTLAGRTAAIEGAEGSAGGLATLNGASRVLQLLATPTITQLQFGGLATGLINSGIQIPYYTNGTGVPGDVVIILATMQIGSSTAAGNHVQLKLEQGGFADAYVDSDLGNGNARPKTFFAVFTISGTGTYTIKVIGGTGGAGNWTISGGQALVINVRP